MLNLQLKFEMYESGSGDEKVRIHNLNLFEINQLQREQQISWLIQNKVYTFLLVRLCVPNKIANFDIG